MALVESIPPKKYSYYNPNWLTQAKSKSKSFFFFLTIVLWGGAPIKNKKNQYSHYYLESGVFLSNYANCYINATLHVIYSSAVFDTSHLSRPSYI